MKPDHTRAGNEKLAQEMFSIHFLIVSDDHCHTQHEHITSTKWKVFSWDKQPKTMTTFSSFSHPFFVDFCPTTKNRADFIAANDDTDDEIWERQVLRCRIGHHGNVSKHKNAFLFSDCIDCCAQMKSNKDVILHELLSPFLFARLCVPKNVL